MGFISPKDAPGRRLVPKSSRQRERGPPSDVELKWLLQREKRLARFKKYLHVNDQQFRHILLNMNKYSKELLAGYKRHRHTILAMRKQPHAWRLRLIESAGLLGKMRAAEARIIKVNAKLSRLREKLDTKNEPSQSLKEKAIDFAFEHAFALRELDLSRLALEGLPKPQQFVLPVDRILASHSAKRRIGTDTFFILLLWLVYSLFMTLERVDDEKAAKLGQSEVQAGQVISAAEDLASVADECNFLLGGFGVENVTYDDEYASITMGNLTLLASDFHDCLKLKVDRELYRDGFGATRYSGIMDATSFPFKSRCSIAGDKLKWWLPQEFREGTEVDATGAVTNVGDIDALISLNQIKQKYKYFESYAFGAAKVGGATVRTLTLNLTKDHLRPGRTAPNTVRCSNQIEVWAPSADTSYLAVIEPLLQADVTGARLYSPLLKDKSNATLFLTLPNRWHTVKADKMADVLKIISYISNLNSKIQKVSIPYSATWNGTNDVMVHTAARGVHLTWRTKNFQHIGPSEFSNPVFALTNYTLPKLFFEVEEDYFGAGNFQHKFEASLKDGTLKHLNRLAEANNGSFLIFFGPRRPQFGFLPQADTKTLHEKSMVQIVFNGPFPKAFSAPFPVAVELAKLSQMAGVKGASEKAIYFKKGQMDIQCGWSSQDLSFFSTLAASSLTSDQLAGAKYISDGKSYGLSLLDGRVTIGLKAPGFSAERAANYPDFISFFTNDTFKNLTKTKLYFTEANLGNLNFTKLTPKILELERLGRKYGRDVLVYDSYSEDSKGPLVSVHYHWWHREKTLEESMDVATSLFFFDHLTLKYNAFKFQRSTSNDGPFRLLSEKSRITLPQRDLPRLEDAHRELIERLVAMNVSEAELDFFGRGISLKLASANGKHEVVNAKPSEVPQILENIVNVGGLNISMPYVARWRSKDNCELTASNVRFTLRTKNYATNYTQFIHVFNNATELLASYDLARPFVLAEDEYFGAHELADLKSSLKNGLLKPLIKYPSALVFGPEPIQTLPEEVNNIKYPADYVELIKTGQSPHVLVSFGSEKNKVFVAPLRMALVLAQLAGYSEVKGATDKTIQFKDGNLTLDCKWSERDEQFFALLASGDFTVGKLAGGEYLSTSEFQRLSFDADNTTYIYAINANVHTSKLPQAGAELLNLLGRAWTFKTLDVVWDAPDGALYHKAVGLEETGKTFTYISPDLTSPSWVDDEFYDVDWASSEYTLNRGDVNTFSGVWFRLNKVIRRHPLTVVFEFQFADKRGNAIRVAEVELKAQDELFVNGIWFYMPKPSDDSNAAIRLFVERPKR